MEKLNKWLIPVNTIAVIVIVFVMLVGGQSASVGGSTSATWTAANLVSEGTLTTSGAATLASASITGAATVGSTLGVTSTTTISDGMNLNNPGICINFYATSTDTRTHMQASTTATIEGVDGVMMWGYGSCSY